MRTLSGLFVLSISKEQTNPTFLCLLHKKSESSSLRDFICFYLILKEIVSHQITKSVVWKLKKKIKSLSKDSLITQNTQLLLPCLTSNVLVWTSTCKATSEIQCMSINRTTPLSCLESFVDVGNKNFGFLDYRHFKNTSKISAMDMNWEISMIDMTWAIKSIPPFNPTTTLFITWVVTCKTCERGVKLCRKLFRQCMKKRLPFHDKDSRGVFGLFPVFF